MYLLVDLDILETIDRDENVEILEKKQKELVGNNYRDQDRYIIIED